MGFKLVILSAVRKEEVVGIRSKFPTKVPVRSLFLFLLLFHQHPEFTYAQLFLTFKSILIECF